MKTQFIRLTKKTWILLPESIREVIRNFLYRSLSLFNRGIVSVHVHRIKLRFVHHTFHQYWGAKLSYAHEPECVDEFLNLVPKMSVVYDIGASFGFYTILASAINPNAQVFSFEPEATMGQNLLNNIKLNRANNTYLLPYAVGEVSGEVNLVAPTTAAGTGCYRTLNESGIPVKMVSLDSLLSNGDIDAPNLIKIDIEGYEFRALLGMQKILQRGKPYLLIEIHPDLMESIGDSENELDKLMMKMGYKRKDLHVRYQGRSFRHQQCHALFFPDLPNAQ
jgi:FkbM family methyltransferase